jgi:N-acetylglucosaminyldiphosphoundecaprenol N-acetyl-beta-D-mannosaminyltransferase
MGNVKIFELEIPKNNFADIQEWTKKTLLGSKQTTVAKINSEFLLRSQKDAEFKEYLLGADLLIPDGAGVLWAATYLRLPITKYQVLRQIQAVYQMIWTGASLVFRQSYAKKVLPARLSGVEVLKTMLAGCQESGQTVYFFGARAEVLSESITILKKEFPKLNIAGSHDGYSDKGAKVVADIQRTKPQLLIVALGSPEQEYWIRDNLAKLPSVKVAVGEGGSFDYIAGAGVRAPKLIQKLGVEWLWRGLFAKNRTTTGPHRLIRIWNAVPVFIAHVVKYKLTLTK